jgi:Uma2 family endonuclease
MTALPKPPHRLLTVAEYAGLGEDERHRYELQDGSLIVSPSPTPDHGAALLALAQQIAPQLPDHLEVLLELDVETLGTSPVSSSPGRRSLCGSGWMSWWIDRA